MRPYATVRAAVIVIFLAWVLSSVIPFTEPPRHVRATDATASDVPPRSDKGTRRTAPLLTGSEVADILRWNGYQQITSLKEQPDGSWAATASRAVNGPKLDLRVASDGQIAKR